jgi:hypothetical protein
LLKSINLIMPQKPNLLFCSSTNSGTNDVLPGVPILDMFPNISVVSKLKLKVSYSLHSASSFPKIRVDLKNPILSNCF